MLKAIKRLFKDESGQGMVEYALIIGVIVVALFLAFTNPGIRNAITTSSGTRNTEIAAKKKEKMMMSTGQLEKNGNKLREHKSLEWWF
jgi:Flp pilus assembly pilin Flp